MMNNICKKWLGYVGVILFTIHCSLFTVSCSEDDSTEGEWDNWQERNDAATDAWAANSAYRQIVCYTKDASATNKKADYVYVEVLESGSGSESPFYTDTVRVAYRGRLIPSASYADGLVFDQTYQDDFNWQTVGVSTDLTAGGFMPGFSTALQNMHIGDHWRVRIPYSLMYGSSSGSSYPAYSNMIFDVALIDFWHPGENRPPFKARQK